MIQFSFFQVFARGAMREAYRLKKLPSFGGQDNSSPAYNYVAKKYVYPVERKVGLHLIEWQ